MEAWRVIDNVCEILREESRSLVAAELAERLRIRGIELDRVGLNRILWARENQRVGLTVDVGFRWSFTSADSATNVRNTQEPAGQAKQVEEMLRQLGFVWEGVRRRADGLLLFFLGETGENYRVVGPTGRVMSFPADLFDSPEVALPSDFTPAQVLAAVNATQVEEMGLVAQQRKLSIKQLIETEVWYASAYLGSPVERVTDFIPVDATIFSVTVPRVGSCLIRLGPATVHQPVYLVIDVLDGFGDSRHGVFRLSVYELVKLKLVLPDEADLTLTLRGFAEGVCIEGLGVTRSLD